MERDRFREAMFGSRKAYHDMLVDKTTKSYAVGYAMAAAAQAWPSDLPIALTDTGMYWDSVKRFIPLRRHVKIKLFATPTETLLVRNRTRDPEHRVPDDVLADFIAKFNEPDPWWLNHPNVETILS